MLFFAVATRIANTINVIVCVFFDSIDVGIESGVSHFALRHQTIFSCTFRCFTRNSLAIKRVALLKPMFIVDAIQVGMTGNSP